MRRLALFITMLLLTTTVALTGGTAAQAATVPAQFVDDIIMPSVSKPTGIAFMPDGRAVVTTQPGKVLVRSKGGTTLTNALDLGAKMCTNSERGILGVATDPSTTTKAIFLFYTLRGANTSCPTNASGTVMPAGSPVNRVSRFVLKDNNTIDPATETVLLDGIYSPAGYHNAGDLHVGADGYLYVSTGDGGCDYRGGVSNPGGSGCGGANDASRDRNILNGKVLRVTLSGGVPPDNPFLGAGTASCRTAPAAAGTICQEAWAWGLRNPFRMAFDPNATSTTFRINDVGQDAWEEINLGTRGADYGWNAREGHCAQTGSETNCGGVKPAQYTDPFYDYGHSTGCASITGGAFVPDGIWPASFTGAYLFSDYVCGKIASLSVFGEQSDFMTGLGTSSAVAMAFGYYGTTQALYYTTYAGAGGGEVHRVSYTGAANRPPTAVIGATPTTGASPLAVTFSGAGSSDPDGDTLNYLWDFGDGTTVQTTTANTTTHTYALGTWTASLRTRDPAGLLSTPVTTTISSGNRAPTATISAPAASALFTSGTDYTLTGSATDPEDGALPSSALSWTIIRRHNTHTHPFFGPQTGNNIVFTAPGPEDLAAAANSDLAIQLTATDSKGVTTTTTQTFAPRKVDITFATAPAGRTVTVNNTPVTGPTTVTSWAGSALQLAIPAQTDANGQPYDFVSWSDGGASSHAYTTPASAATLTATLAARPATVAPPTSVSAGQSAAASATITWSPPPTGTVTGYRVSRDGVDSAGEGAYTTTVADTVRSFTMTRLVSGRSYNLSVQAITAAGTSAAVTRAVPITGWAAPGVPTSVAASQSAAASATITWAPPATDGGQAISGYRISRDGVDSAGEGAYTTTVAASERTFTLTRLVGGSTYNISVAAINAAGTGTAVSRAVTIAPPAPVAFAADDFARTVASGWGTAPTGGAWSIAGTASNLSVSGAVGVASIPAGSTRTATLPAISKTAADVQVSLALDTVPTGGGSYATVVGRQVGTSKYIGSAWIKSTGVVTLVLQQGSTVLGAVAVPALTYTAGASLQVRLQVTGTSPTTVRGKIWRTGQAEPSAWLSSVTDSAAALQSAGTVGLQSSLSSSATATVVTRFDNFSATAP